MSDRYCRDQAREELILMLGGGAAAGLAGEIPVFGFEAYNVTMTAIQGIVVSRIASIYGIQLLAAGGAGALAATVMALGGANFLFFTAQQLAGYLPGMGQVVRPALSAATLWAFGEAAIAYFENLYPNRVYQSNAGNSDDSGMPPAPT